MTMAYILVYLEFIGVFFWGGAYNSTKDYRCGGLHIFGAISEPTPVLNRHKGGFAFHALGPFLSVDQLTHGKEKSEKHTTFHGILLFSKCVHRGA